MRPEAVSDAVQSTGSRIAAGDEMVGDQSDFVAECPRVGESLSVDRHRVELDRDDVVLPLNTNNSFVFSEQLLLDSSHTLHTIVVLCICQWTEKKQYCFLIVLCEHHPCSSSQNKRAYETIPRMSVGMCAFCV